MRNLYGNKVKHNNFSGINAYQLDLLLFVQQQWELNGETPQNIHKFGKWNTEIRHIIVIG